MPVSDTPARPKDSTANTAEVTETDKIEWPECRWDEDEATLDTLRNLPRTFRDIPYPEDDDL
jgi:hypothetical protein